MVEMTIQKLNDVGLDDLADFIFDRRQESVFRSERRTPDTVKSVLKEAARDENNLVIVARKKDSKEIVGCLRFDVGFPAFAFSNSWQPLVMQSDDREIIAKKMIHAFKEYAAAAGYTRVEALLSPINEIHSDILVEYRNWFLSEGFYLASGEVFMEVNLEKIELPKPEPKLPEGYKFKSIEDKRNEEIKEPFFETFMSGKDRLFLDMIPAQRLTAFNYWFRRSSPIHKSSLIVVKDNDVVGFSVTRPEEDSVNIGPFGVHPNHKGKGIGKALLHRMMKILFDEGVGLAKLEADATNTPALNLYRKYGFDEKDKQEYYAWRAD